MGGQVESQEVGQAAEEETCFCQRCWVLICWGPVAPADIPFKDGRPQGILAIAKGTGEVRLYSQDTANPYLVQGGNGLLVHTVLGIQLCSD